MTTPLLTPLTLDLHIAYRSELLRECQTNPLIRAAVWQKCADDPVFFINTFCWLLETRDAAEWQLGGKFGRHKVIPFILREYQAKAVREAQDNLGVKDIVVVKSRETGVTWIFIALAVWDWLFHEETHIGCASKDEASVDSSDDPDSLFNKIQFLLDRLPSWMLPAGYERNRSDSVFHNKYNGSTISGYAATSNVARGGRKRWMLMDEFHFFPAGKDYEAHDSTSHVTRCRVMVSTPARKKGRGGAFYDAVMAAPETHALLIDIDWKDDPEKARGLYTAVDRKLKILDTEFWAKYHIEGDRYRHPWQLDNEYQFNCDGKVRSLYYDYECSRPLATPQSIASELDKNFSGATAQFVDAGVLEAAEQRAREPVFMGEILKTPDGWILDRSVLGEAFGYTSLPNGRPPVGEYSLGADVAAGTGGAYSSYSAVTIFDKRNGHEVFAWRSNNVGPVEFASLLCWLGKFFWNAYLVVESNGPIGQLCMKEVVRLKYPKIYYRNKDKRAYQSKTEEPGYWNTDGGELILGNMERAIRERQAHVHTKLALREMGQYFFRNGKLVNAASANTQDEAGKGRAHGDMAISAAVAWHGVEDWPAPGPDKKPRTSEPPVGSFLHRQKEAQKRARQRGSRSYWNPRYH